MRTAIATDAEAVEPGIYNVTLKSINDGVGQYGDFYDWTFSVAGPNGSVEVSRRTSTLFTPNANARKFAQALLGRDVMKGEAVDLDDLVGRNAVARITTNDNGYSTIDALKPAPAGTAAVPAAPRMDAPPTFEQQAAKTQAAVFGAPSDEQILAAAGPGSAFVQPNADEVPF